MFECMFEYALLVSLTGVASLAMDSEYLQRRQTARRTERISHVGNGLWYVKLRRVCVPCTPCVYLPRPKP